jgi:hypothetical protein
MKAAETRASSAIADWTPLTVVWRSRTTDEIDTFMIEVSTTSTNIAIANKTASGRFIGDSSMALCRPSSVTEASHSCSGSSSVRWASWWNASKTGFSGIVPI